MTNSAAGYPPEKLIFLLGIMPRSGTNYLFDLILAHRGTTASHIPEDHFVAYSSLLDMFVQSIVRDINPAWGTDETRLYEGLRHGLVSLLADADEPRRIVSKTPSVTNLDLFFKLFPTSKLVILVRDGRAVTESAVRSFKHMTMETATRQWATAAQRISRFIKTQQERRQQFMLLRYEDLYTHQTEVLKRLYAFLELDTAEINFEALQNIPVRGSSTLRGENAEKVHWNPIAKTEDFNPLERFKHWTPAQHARFNWLAGDALRLFDYEPWPAKGASLVWQGYNRWHDAQQSLQRVRPFMARQVRRFSRRQ
jgi:hypothetical protein